MSKVSNSSGEPRAIVHKRILEVAADEPEASLADEVSGATPDLVERVLSEYGDPGETDVQQNETMSQQSTPDQETEEQETADQETVDQPAAAETDEEASETDDGERPAETDDTNHPAEPDDADHPADSSVGPGVQSPDDLTVKQRETARTIYENPTASQGEIADRLDVSTATVSRRVNDIPGFEWADRETFTSNLFDDTEFDTDSSVGEESTAATGQSVHESEFGAALSRVEERLDTVEDHLDTTTDRPEDASDGQAGGLRPELAQKVVHAAMESEQISEDEELELLETLLDW